MALKECANCGYRISAKRKSCPSCGEPIFEQKGHKVGLLVLLLMGLLFAKVITGNGDFDKLVIASDPLPISPTAKDLELEKQAKFIARELRLVEELKKIPASKYEENRNRYAELVELDPDEALYKTKLDHYEGKIKAAKELLETAEKLCRTTLEKVARLDGYPHNLAECLKNPQRYLGKITSVNLELAKKAAPENPPVIKIPTGDRRARSACRNAIIKSATFPAKVDFPFIDYELRELVREESTILTGNVGLLNTQGQMVPHAYHCEYLNGRVANLELKPR